VYLHIPKTGGRTLRSALVTNFSKERQIHLDILDRPLDDELASVPIETRSAARLVWGHLPYGVHRHLPQECDYFTILREPVARVTSAYKYILRTPGHVLHDRVVQGNISFGAYVESGIDEGQTENSQTRQLSGKQFGPLGYEALEEAKAHLRRFLLVGITEQFEETFVLLRRTLRLRVPLYVTRNVSPPFHASPHELELARERNELDLELYRFARELFAQTIDREGRFFALEVGAYRGLRPVSRVAGRSAALRTLGRLWTDRRRSDP
jgi:hypothetical protein